MCCMNEQILRLNGRGLSNRAIAKALGISRESVNKAVREMGKTSPFARPEKKDPPLPRAYRSFHAGELFGRFQGGGEDGSVSLRAIVIRQYSRFVHCRVEAWREGIWEYVYDQCFQQIVQGGKNGL